MSTSSEARNLLIVSIQWACIQGLWQYDLMSRLQAIYGSLITQTEAGYDFSVQIDLDAPPSNLGKTRNINLLLIMI